MSEHSHWQAVVVAGGVGRRFGATQPKQFVTVLGVPLIWHTLAGILSTPFVDMVTVVIKDEATFEKWLPEHTRLCFAPSGAERFDSVLSGLRRLAKFHQTNCWTLVHDAARPLVCHAMIEKLREHLDLHCELDGVITARPAVDTVKKTEGVRIKGTIDRRTLWFAETPQVFRLHTLLTAMQNTSTLARPLMTDEASVMEAVGAQIDCVSTGIANQKLTQSTDLEFIEWQLRRQIEMGLRPEPRAFFKQRA